MGKPVSAKRPLKAKLSRIVDLPVSNKFSQTFVRCRENLFPCFRVHSVLIFKHKKILPLQESEKLKKINLKYFIRNYLL